MATMQCKACGASFRYEQDGCCPKCGAYNRPPKREVVNADGTVQHMTDAAYEKRRYAQGKVCFEEKECHEEKKSYQQKVCYEDQARDPEDLRDSIPAPAITASLVTQLRQANRKAYKQAFSNRLPAATNIAEESKLHLPGCLVFLVVAIIFLAVMGIIAVSIFARFPLSIRG